MAEAAPLAPQQPEFLKQPETLTPDDYRVTVDPARKRVKVVFNGKVIASTRRALVLKETRLPPVYYLPREDIAMEYLAPSAHRTYCPFKGTATYWNLTVGDKTVENVAWSYEDPIEEALGIRGHIAFYWNKVEAWFAKDQPVEIDATESTAEGANPLAGWLLREAWEATSSAELVDRFARQLVEAGFCVLRLSVIIPTLHPQLASNAFVWRRGESVVDERDLPHYGLQSEAYLKSPIIRIFNGEGGIRRRLEGATPPRDFPILDDLLAEGATDYVAMPMRFSNGKINVMTIACDRPGGFATQELGWIHEALPILSRLLEVQAMHRTARSLLETYLGAYTGQRVLNGLVKRGDGDDIPAVIWYCDLRGSTALADSLPRADYLDLLNRYFEAVAGAVLEHGGEVLKFIGDGLLAIFPMEKMAACDAEDELYCAKSGIEQGAAATYCGKASCNSAIEAARDALQRMVEVNAVLAEAGREPLRFGLSLHLGDVTYGNIGAASRLDFTVIGPATNEAARMDTLTKELGIGVLVSEDFERFVPGTLVSVGRHRLRGVALEREIFTLPELAKKAAE
jgi:adenylate cyclase